ncbi:MAG: ABC transporter ATP-binding protein [Hyphomicrobiales bacterium]|nr:ABC transporter ATP-binding protein [Hyphomicrobiales bacterium]
MKRNGSAAILELHDISRQFVVRRGLFKKRQFLKAVDGVSLELNKGDVLGLVGESGCGKSTLARILLGLLPPTSGTVLFNGAHVSDANKRMMKRHIQPIFQDPYSSLNPRKTVNEIIAAPLGVHGIGTVREREQDVRRMMELVGLPARAFYSYPGQLSGGQCQRVAIARALIMKPEVVICDEPTSALDVSVQSQILNLLLDLRDELGLTYLIISHNLAVVEHMATRVAVMYLGRIVEANDARALFGAPRHPYTRALMQSVLTPEPGLGVPDNHLGLAYPDPLDPPEGCGFHPRCAPCRDAGLAICRAERPPAVRDREGWVECFLHSGSAELPSQ